MATLDNYRNEKFVKYCEEQLREYVELYAGIDAALIATADGFEISSYAQGRLHSADKLAAVGSSLFSLGDALVQEFNLMNCKSIILDSDRGKVYISDIHNKQHSIILMIQTTEQATLGNIIHGAKKLNTNISKKLKEIPVSPVN